MSQSTEAPRSLRQPVDWWKSAVVYEVYPRSFQDSDGYGIGDVRSIIARLDYLAALGVDVVWLSPIYRSPHDEHGYDIDPMFGSMADVEQLIRGVHDRGMRLVMGLVVNPTSDEHPWFVESRSSADSAKRDLVLVATGPPGAQAGDPGRRAHELGVGLSATSSR
jgi:oligo-1,6-glucosidase